MLELAAEAVKDLTSYKHYEGGRTTSGVGAESGFAFARRRRGCYCVPAAGESCGHSDWTGELDKGTVVPAKPARAGGGAAAVTRKAKRSGASASFRSSIGANSLLQFPGAEDDETADGETIWYANALGPQEKNEETYDCGPCRLVKGHYSIPIEWLNLEELTDEYAIFTPWPTEQNRIIAATLAMEMPDIAWAKVENGRYYLAREHYDLGNEQSSERERRGLERARERERRERSVQLYVSVHTALYLKYNYLSVS